YTSTGTETSNVNLCNFYSNTTTAPTPTLLHYTTLLRSNALGVSPQSNEASATPPTIPSAPQNLLATAGTGNVALTWDTPSSDGGSAITGYKVYRSTSSVTETGYVNLGNVNSYDNTAVTP